MASVGPLVYWDRKHRQEAVERVYGDAGVRWLYATRLGQRVADLILSRSWISRLVGLYQSSALSRRRIQPFIEQYRISMDEFEVASYGSFNDFFIRKFRPGAREVAQEAGTMPAFAEGRYLAWDRLDLEQTFPVKGRNLSPEAILGSRDRARPFEGGPVLICRLCPTDYHRFHYPDDGHTEAYYRIPGRLHSVNPLALVYKDDLFATNERVVSLLETSNFGRLAYVEVGALCVGRIVQTHSPDLPFRRGDEKGYFLFGGSTVILFGEPGRWKPDTDVVSKTHQRRETLIRFGEPIAYAK